MRSSTSIRAFAAVLLCFLSTAVSQADEPLRWKFKAGDQLNFSMSQDMNMDAGAALKMGRQQTMDTTWAIKTVDAAGNAVVDHKIDRIRVRMAGPAGQSFDFDSDSEEPAVGMAAMVAPSLKALTSGTTEFTISPRADVTNVKVSPELLSAMKGSPASQSMTDEMASQQFKQMVSQVAIALPEEALAKGSTWNTKLEVTNPAAGSETVETTFTFDGLRDVDGVSLAVIKPALKMNVTGNADIQMKMKEQKTSGEVLFNPEAGRLHSMKIVQDVTLDLVAAGQTLPGTINQKIDVTVTPASAEDTAEKSAPKVKTKVLAE